MCARLTACLIRNHEHAARFQNAVNFGKAARNLRPEIHRFKRRHNIEPFILKGQLQYIPLHDRTTPRLDCRAVHLPRLFHGNGRVVQPRHMTLVHHP